jgi:integrase
MKGIAMKLTQRDVGTVVVPSGKSEVIQFDDAIPGFGYRVRVSGAATWIFQYKLGSKQRRLTLGSAKAIGAKNAREIASKLHARVRLGEDPAGDKIESRAKAAETFGSILQPFLSVKKTELKARSFQEVERHLLQRARRLHGMQLSAIDRRTVANLLTNLAANSGPAAANSIRASLSAFFSWAMREGLAEANPVIGSNKAAVNASRDRVLTDDELRAIWNAVGDDAYGDIVKLLALTGQRRDEIGALRWSEVNLDKALISLPAERTKNSRPHDIPLSPAALSILEARPLARSELVFTGGRYGFGGWSNYKIALDARIAAKGAIAPWRLHDLRRTAATRMAELGVLPHIIEAVLNHVSGHKSGVAGIYNRATYENEKRQALSVWAEALDAIVTGRSSKIVAISKGTARR